MVKSCCAVNCNSKLYHGNNISFHRFPLGNKDVLKKWVSNIRRKNFTPTRNHMICSEHFRKEDFVGNVASGRRYLKPEAIPTMFTIPEKLEKDAEKRQIPACQRPPDPPLSRPLQPKEKKVNRSSLGMDAVDRDHSYSLPTSPDEEGPAKWVVQTCPPLLQNGESRTRSERDTPEEPLVNSEADRQNFRRYCYQEAEGPHIVCSRLWDLCQRWLRPGKHTKLQMLELVIMEQFLAILPQEMQDYVTASGPANCDQAVSLAEDFLKRQRAEEMQQPLVKVALNFPTSKEVSTSTQQSPQLRGVNKKEGDTTIISEDGTEREIKIESSPMEDSVLKNMIPPENISSVMGVVEKTENSV